MSRVALKANDPCWCGSGRKYKRCHRPTEGRIAPGIISPRRDVPASILRPDYADSELGIPQRWREPMVIIGSMVKVMPGFIVMLAAGVK